MELKTKYQYTYFIHQYVIEEKQYRNYIYKLLKNKKCKLKIFDSKKNIGIETYFLPEIKEKMFWTLDCGTKSIKDYEKADTKMKANMLCQKECNIFEYELEKDIPGKIIEKNGIFFDISKVEIICFNTGICFILFKTVLNDNSSLHDVLNFNYKFKNMNSKVGKTVEFNNIKIQTEKLNNMQSFQEFIQEIAGNGAMANKVNIDVNQLITYSYTCLEQSSLENEEGKKVLEKEFEKYRTVQPEEEKINDVTLRKEVVYKDNNMYLGFSSNSTVLLTCDNNIKNYTTLLFQYENEYLYHYIFNLYKKNYLKKLNYEFKKSKKFDLIKDRFIAFAKKYWIYEITNDNIGKILEKYYVQEQGTEKIFLKTKQQYDLSFKEKELLKNKKQNKYLGMAFAVIIILIIINIILLSKFL